MKRNTRTKTLAVCVAIAAASVGISGCTDGSRVVDGTEVTVATGQAFYSYNGNTSYGSSSTANEPVIAATNSRFASYDSEQNLVPDESFGTAKILAKDPLSIEYTVGDDVTWSDGVPVDAADLLLAWAANSGALNTPDFDDSPYLDEDTQQYTDDFPDDAVFFDGSTGGGLQLVTSTPVIGDDGRSITLAYDDYFVDWRLVFDVGLPAHVVASEALGIDDPSDAKETMIDAIENGDDESLAPISRFWNAGFNFTETPTDASLLVSTGPYTIDGFDSERLTLRANPRYRGDHKPAYETVVVRYISDPLEAVQALADGEVDVITPQPTENVARSLLDIDDITVASGFDGAYERLDLQMTKSRSGVFDSPVVREAFLHVVPRRAILDELVVPLQEDAEVRSSHVFLPGSVEYERSVDENGSESYRDVDVALAERLLADAGVSSPEVCMLFDPANPRRVAEFQLIQASASEAGFRVTDCSSADWRDLLGVPGQYDASLYALRSRNLAVTTARASFSSVDGVNNTSFYANQRVDALLDELDSTTGAQEQSEILTEVDRLVWDDAAGAPLYQYPSITAFSSEVTGVTPSPLAPGVLGNAWEWKPRSEG